MSYEDPIELIYKEINDQRIAAIENGIFKAVEEVGISVNKEELLKALAYDRDQYQKGYADGRRAMGNIVRCKDCKYGVNTTNILGENRVKCDLSNSFVYQDITLPPDWYCADGEEKTDEDML